MEKSFINVFVLKYNILTEVNMIGYLLMFASASTSLAEGILIKQYNKKHSKGGFMFTALVSVFGLVFFVVKNLTSLSFELALLPYALIGGGLYCAASIFTYFALQWGSFAITMLVLSYSLLISILYGIIALGETGSAFTYIGFAVIILSIFLVRRKPDADEKKSFSFKWLIAMVISVLGSGFFSVVQRMQQIKFEKAYDGEFMIIVYAVTAVALIITAISIDKKDCFYILKKGGPYAALAGIANGATNMLGMLVNTMVPISISTPTRSALKSVISFIVSLFVFKEKFEKRQVTGVVLGAVAVVLLNL